MPFSSGVFSRVYNWVTDKNNSVPITASRMDTEMNGMATGLSTCVLKDGTQTITANIPMSGFKFTGLGAGSAATDSATVAQVQANGFAWCGSSGGTANAQTLTPSPVITAYAAGQRFSFLPVATNTSGTVTIANSGLAVRNVKKSIGGALVILAVGDLQINVPAEVIDDGTQYVLLNPYGSSHGADVASATTTVLSTTTGNIVDVTGTTTITAITLAEGESCWVRFAGILTLTHGASLVLPGSASITTAAGDYAYFIGYASSVVRCAQYLKLDGTAVVVAAPTFPPSFRNPFINADASVAQRGTSFTAIAATVVQTLDGWFGYAAGGASEKVSQVSGVASNGFNYAIRMARPSGDTSTANHRIAQIIETYDCYRFAGQVCTLSYYAKAGANFSAPNVTTSIVTGTAADEGNAGISGSSWTGIATPLNTNISPTTSWVRYSHSVTIASGAKEICVKFLMTPAGTAGAEDWVDFTGVQLDIGSVTAFDFIPFSMSLDRCKRFYQKTFSYATAPAQSAGVVGALHSKPFANNAGFMSAQLQYEVEMRTIPTITTYNTSASNANWRDVTAGSDVVVSVDPNSAKSADRLMITAITTALTAANNLYIHVQSEAAL